ncbi:MAG: hypothetical protein ACD_84C00004G0008 [uncultured bacterium]|nr:MAG: hypothetical protein ACD_84C00004G0008 [uncultured bacterium]
MNTAAIPDASTAIKTAQTFEEKMKARIKDGIGDLLSDEDLTKMIHRGLEETFFAKRFESSAHWSAKSAEKEPLIQEIIKETLRPAVEQAVKDWILSHEAEIMQMTNNVITNGVGAAVMSALTSQFSIPLSMLQSNVSTMMHRNNG